MSIINNQINSNMTDSINRLHNEVRQEAPKRNLETFYKTCPCYNKQFSTIKPVEHIPCHLVVKHKV